MLHQKYTKDLLVLTNFEIPLGREKQAGKKKLGYYEIENIDNPCILTLSVNPKEYLEILKNQHQNRKHKGIKKGSPGLGFENFFIKNKIIDYFLDL